MIKLVVFDMAGTTVDEDNVVYKTVRAAINAAGYLFSQDQVQQAGAGKEKSQAIRDVLALDGKPHSEVEVALIFDDFKRRLRSGVRRTGGARAARSIGNVCTASPARNQSRSEYRIRPSHR